MPYGSRSRIGERHWFPPVVIVPFVQDQASKARVGSATMSSASDVLFLPPDGGRCYQVGPMRAVFKADGEETADAYCVSEWWLEAGDDGPGPHSHENNVEIFYVVERTMSFLAGDTWLEAPRGSFLRIPAGVTHDFANRSDVRAGALNVFMPGGFEPMMDKIIAWFAEQGSTTS